VTAPAPPAASGRRGHLHRVLSYQRPFRDRVAGAGLVAAAPVSVAFLATSLVASALWRDGDGGHRLVAACCAWRATDLGHGSPLPLLGSALLVRRPVEALWTVAATWLVLGPLEVVAGSRRLLVVAALGHVVPTVLVDLCWLAGPRSGWGLGGLDVGTSGVIVTAAAALAVATSSLPVAAVLAAALAVDVAAAPGLATAEHLVAVAVGVGLATALSRRRAAPVPARPPHEGAVRVPPHGGQLIGRSRSPS
jgi:hypothetical protein